MLKCKIFIKVGESLIHVLATMYHHIEYFFLLPDINECEEDKTLCSGDKQHCENNDGSYACVCEEGFILDSENNCIPKPKGR